jgi:RNA polymerase sigma factor (sigma-70 family)
LFWFDRCDTNAFSNVADGAKYLSLRLWKTFGCIVLKTIFLPFATLLAFSMSHDLMTDDKTLVARVLAGDTQAFMLLIKQHERLVAHMVGRLIKSEEDREELCQDVFLRVHEKLAEFTFQSKLSTWIATIAYRMGINHLRKQKMSFSDIPDEESFTKRFIEVSNPETLTEEKDMDGFILKLVAQLPPQYRVVLTLYHVDGMSYPEIGEISGMPEGTVKNYLFRARNLLKEKVKQYLGKEELL